MGSPYTRGCTGAIALGRSFSSRPAIAVDIRGSCWSVLAAAGARHIGGWMKAVLESSTGREVRVLPPRFAPRSRRTVFRRFPRGAASDLRTLVTEDGYTRFQTTPTF